ncbi:MAG: rRNA pseudouridine synthase [Spirochaetaceae bacterium]|nr:rRNA pseudouridine synthase [Spirochaetaceae bacterium]
MRLQAYLAHAGVASRRSSENLITEGHVTVNGELVTVLGTKVTSDDKVCVDGVPVQPEETFHYVLLNKPSGVVCSLADEKNRPVAADILRPHFKERLYNVGRLDMFSSGLIIFTNDGQFAAKVSHPSAELEKEYIVETSTSFPESLTDRFTKGIRIDSVFYKCRTAERLSSRKMRVVLVEGKNREIRRVFEHFDVRVKKLTRIRIGSISMLWPLGSEFEGRAMQEGEFRELAPEEVQGILRV